MEGSTRVLTLLRIGLDVPEGPYETVAGLVADLLGRIPAPGDRAELPGWRVSVRQVGHYRAEQVRFVRLNDVPAPPAERPEKPERPERLTQDLLEAVR